MLFLAGSIGCDSSVEPLEVRIRPQPIVINGDTHWTDWSEYASGFQPSDFTQEWDATTFFSVADDPDIPGNKFLQWSANGVSRNRWGLAYNGLTAFGDQEVLTDVRIRSVGTGPGVWYMGSAAVRITGTASNEGGYVLWFVHSSTAPASLALATWTNGGYTQLGTSSLVWSFDEWYTVRLRAVGNSIQAKAWPRGTPEPAGWSINVTDSRWASGRPGVANHDNGTVQWDNWSVTVLPPPNLVSISISPTAATLSPGDTLRFSTLGHLSNGGTTAVAVSYTATGGTIDAGGLLTAGAATGTYHVITTSLVNPALADTAVVTISNTPPPLPLVYDFTDGAAGIAPMGWTESAYPAGSDWVVADLPLASDNRALRNVTTTTSRHVLRANVIPDTATVQEIVVKLRLGDPDTRGPGVILRHRMAGNLESGYVAYLRPVTDRVEINSFNNGVWGFVGDVVFPNDPGVWYWLRFRAEGTQLRVRVWADGTPEPATWTREVASTLVPSGSAGLYTYEPNTVDYDYAAFAVAGGTAPLPPSGPPPPPPTLTSIVMTPATVSVSTGATAQFTVTGVLSDGNSSTPAVTYSATGGTIDTNGLFTAGASTGSFPVIATSVDNPALVDTSVVTITAAPTLTQITLSPATASLDTGATLQFSMSGQMSDGATVTPAVTYTATGGSITAGGLFTAGAAGGNYTVVAVSTLNPALADTSFLTINVPPPPPPPGSGTYSEPFVTGVNGTLPAGWTETSAPGGSDWTLFDEATATDGRVLRDVVTGVGRHILRYDAVPDTTTVQEVLVRMRFGDADGRGPGVALRHRMAGTLESAYVAYFRPNNDVVEVNAFNNGAWSFVGSFPFPNNPGVWYWLRFRAEGTSLRVRAWADGAAEPAIWMGQYTNALLTTGSAGLYSYEPNTVDYDFFSYAGLGQTAPSAPAGPPPSPLTSITLTPATTTVDAGATAQFQVSGTHADGSTSVPAVSYTASGGTITSTGVFTAGNTAGTFNVVATSVADPSIADTAAVTVTLPPPPTLTSLSLTPVSASAYTNGTIQFAVTGQLSNGTTVVPAVTYTATGGAITSGGFYTAGTVAGTYQVIANSVDNPALADTATVTLSDPPPAGGNQWFTDFSLGTVGQPMPDLRKVRSGTSWAYNAIVRDDAASPGRKVLKLEGPNPTSNGSSRPHAWLLVPVANEQEVVVKLRTTTTAYASGGAYLAGSVSADGQQIYEYGTRLRNGRLQLWNYKNTNFNLIDTAAPLWVPNQWMWIRMRLSATNIMVRYWVDGSAEPTTWHLNAARNFGGNGSGLTIPAGGAGLYMNTVGSGVEFGALGAAINGATAPTAGPVSMGTLPNVDDSGSIYSSTFASETPGQVPANWAPANVTTNVTWNVADVGGLLGLRSVGSSGNAQRLLDYTPMSDNTTDQEVLLRVRPGTATASHSVGAALRIEAPAGGSNTFYGVSFGGQSLEYTRWTNGSRAWLGSGTPYEYSAGQWYWLRARIVGGSLMGKIWRVDEPEPGTYFRVFNDPNITTGSAGIFHWQADTVDITHASIRNN